MKCEQCCNIKFEYISLFENKCTFCGYLQTTFEDTVEFLDVKQYNRCQTYESSTNILIREYMAFLKTIWPDEHFQNLQNDIMHKTKQIPNYNTSILLGIVLKYASMHSIPCNYILHKKKLNISSKELGKALKLLNVGIISEGLCSEHVKKYVELYGDSNIVRPNSMTGKGHAVTKTLAKKIQIDVKPTTQYSMNQFKFIKNILNLINFDTADDKQIFYENICKLYTHFKHTHMCKFEGENIVIISIIYVAAKNKHLIKNVQQYCSKTRFTSAPTLSKILHNYELEKKIQEFKIRNLNIG